MKILISLTLFCLSLFLPASATMSNLTFPKGKTFLPTDSFAYAYHSTRDTTYAKIYVETGSTPSLDTLQDKFFVEILMIDNDTISVWHDNWGQAADADPALHSFLFLPGVANLAPALYHVLIYDRDNSVTDTFRGLPAPNPWRTISGTITPPSGNPKGWITVSARPQNYNNGDFQAYTDTSGNYIIQFDSATVVGSNGQVTVQVKENFPGYLSNPTYRTVNLSVASASSVNFQFQLAPCAVQGKVLSGSNGVPAVSVQLTDSSYNTISQVETNDTGYYKLYCIPGSYRLRISSDNLRPNYMQPQDTFVTVQNGQTLTVNIHLVAADTVIYGRLTKEGNPPGGTFIIGASSQKAGFTWASNDAQGYFTIHVSSLDSSYNVQVENWNDSRYDTIPAGYIVEQGRFGVPTHIGATVLLNMIPQPSTGIAGIIQNNSSYPAASFVINLSPQMGGNSYNMTTYSTGPYVFAGIPNGQYYAQAGMSMTPGQPWNWKLRKDYRDSTGMPVLITINNDTLRNINWIFTNADTVWQPPTNNGVITGKIINQSGLNAVSYTVKVWNNYPDSSGPVRVLTFSDSMFVIDHLDFRSYLIEYGMSITGNPNDLKVDKWYQDMSGRNIWVTVNMTDTPFVQLVITNNDTGMGSISGKASYSGALPKRNITVMAINLNNSDRNSRMVPADTAGNYRCDSLVPGIYKIIAWIDTNRDQVAEAYGQYDNLLTITGPESFLNINITIYDKPAGARAISGAVSYSGVWPSNGLIEIFAVPVDTTLPVGGLTSFQEVMVKGYHAVLYSPGAYSIPGLPDSIYYMLAIVETCGISGCNMLSMGVYGTIPPSGPPLLIPVVAKGNDRTGIDIAIIPPVGAEAFKKSLPKEFALAQPSPNPFNPTVTLGYDVPANVRVTIGVYDISGHMIRMLVNGMRAPGVYQTVWDGRNSLGRSMASGLYLCRMQAGNFVKERKLLMLK